MKNNNNNNTMMSLWSLFCARHWMYRCRAHRGRAFMMYFAAWTQGVAAAYCAAHNFCEFINNERTLNPNKFLDKRNVSRVTKDY